VPKPKNTRLSVFKGREARLNRVIFRILASRKLLTSYDMYLEIRRIKGFRHTKYPSVDRRMKALRHEHWTEEKGTRKTKPGFDSPLYQLSVRGQTALKLTEVDVNDLVRTAEEKLLLELMALLSSFHEPPRMSQKPGGRG
jgi:predicted transcriptional regulator